MDLFEKRTFEKEKQWVFDLRRLVPGDPTPFEAVSAKVLEVARGMLGPA